MEKESRKKDFFNVFIRNILIRKDFIDVIKSLNNVSHVLREYRNIFRVINLVSIVPLLRERGTSISNIISPRCGFNEGVR